MAQGSWVMAKADMPRWLQDYKYVWLAANSTFKADSDLAKYEKARKLKVTCTSSLAWVGAPGSGSFQMTPSSKAGIADDRSARQTKYG